MVREPTMTARDGTRVTTTHSLPTFGWCIDMPTTTTRRDNIMHARQALGTRMVRLALLGLAWLPLGAAAQATSASDAAAVKLATQVCSSCHGPGGNSVSPTFPRLAAQQEAYLVAQISAFKNGSRGEKEAHEYMHGMASLIDD